jgi:hypothetical protein
MRMVVGSICKSHKMGPSRGYIAIKSLEEDALWGLEVIQS